MSIKYNALVMAYENYLGCVYPTQDSPKAHASENLLDLALDSYNKSCNIYNNSTEMVLIEGRDFKSLEFICNKPLTDEQTGGNPFKGID